MQLRFARAYNVVYDMFDLAAYNVVLRAHLPMSGSASSNPSDSDDIHGLDELIAYLNDHGEVLLGLQGPGTEQATNHIAAPVGPAAQPCIVKVESEPFGEADAVPDIAAAQQAAASAAAAAAKLQRAAKKGKLSSSKKHKLELEYLAKEHQRIYQHLQSLKLDNFRLRLKQALLQAINEAKQQVLDVLWQHREATGSSCNQNTISALQQLEQQVQQLLQASGTAAAPSGKATSSTSNSTSSSMYSSKLSGSSNSINPCPVAVTDLIGATPVSLVQQVQQRAMQSALQSSSLQEEQQQQQLDSEVDAEGSSSWWPDPLQDPLWLLNLGMTHLDLSAAVTASREERLVAWKHVQGQLSLLLRAIEGDAGEALTKFDQP
jgi:hypothetical protein